MSIGVGGFAELTAQDEKTLLYRYGENLQKELKVTKESVQEIQVQLKELDEYEKQLRTRKKDD